MVTAQIRLDETKHRQLKSLAAQRSTSVSQLIGEGVDRVLAAAAVEAARRRHAELVDKKFTKSLSDSESAELRALEQDLDTAEAALYQPVLHRLSAKIEALERGSGK
jgi:hypothetical protein